MSGTAVGGMFDINRDLLRRGPGGLVRVQIGVHGTWHAFTIARQLARGGHLQRIYTASPLSKADTDGVPESRICPIRYPTAVEHLGYRLPILNDIVPSRWDQPFERWKALLFDRAVARKLEPAADGLFLGWAGASLASLRRANELGLTTAVERGSSHIRTQKRILETEYDRFDGGPVGISEAHVEREEREYEAADYVVTPSPFARQSFLDHGFDPDRVLCLPFGTDVPPRREPSGGETTTFVFAGRVALRKGIQYLLPAWESLDLPDAELVVASDVDETAQSVVEQYRDVDGVTFRGWVDDIYQLFWDADAFLFPTLEEGSARVTYEAMACELPVVTTFNSGWVGDDGTHGVEVPIRDEDALAAAIRRLAENPAERRQMGTEARELIVENYTEDDYGDRLVSAYESII